MQPARWIVLVLVYTTSLAAQEVGLKPSKVVIEDYSNPPPELVDDFGAFRSPLIDKQGKRVTLAGEWPIRRQEILDDWHSLMGAWPPVLEKPRWSVEQTLQREGIVHQHLTLEIAPEQFEKAWLLVPPGPGPFPAVVVVYYDPETSIGQKPEKPLRDFAWQLSRRGFVTLSLGSPGGDARRPDRGQATCQPLSFLGYVAANAWQSLASMPNVDRRRIGITGHSYGGKWSLFGAALWEPYAAVASSDPGIVFDEQRPSVNYWEPWYLGFDPTVTRKPGLPSESNPRTGAYRVMIEQGRDLHELHALIAPRPFLVSGGSEDSPQRWKALNHLRAINTLLGYSNRVAMQNRPKHDPTVESNEVIYRFFEVALGDSPR